MATRTVTAYDDVSQDFTRKLADAASGPGKLPYIDGRELSAILRQSAQVVTGYFTVGTTTDDDGNVIADADDVELNIGFTPKAFLFIDGNDANPKIYLKMFAMEVAALKNYSLELVAPILTDNSILFNNVAETDTNYVTILNGITVNTKRAAFVAIG